MNTPVTPRGINHLVLNVRDMEESHRFWTEVVGFRQVGRLTPQPDRPNPPNMRFYSGDKGGETHHHDVALVENRDLPQRNGRCSACPVP
jgi:catechol 2,3-dioxygenase-like lactoylglutathione lyase family enzyme